MRKVLLTLAAALLPFTVITVTNAQTFETATNAVKNMGVGWNLGNTLDAHDASKTWTTTEQHEIWWGQPVTKPELMKMMKEAGFGAIRVPVTWYQEMNSDGKVKEAWMKRVKEVVDYVIDNGMYCILNVHHDTGDGSTHWLHASSTNYNKNKTKFEYLWRQIATEFKDYDQHLLFEAYNEMLDDNNTWNEPTNKTDGYQAINNYAKSFVTTVRNTGGNNAQRNLIVNTYSASSTPAAMENLNKPETSNHIIFQIHSYPNWQSKSNAQTEINTLISNIKSKLINRAPVIIGEYATFTEWPTKKDYYDTDRTVALYAMDYLIKKTKEAGIGTFYWMGLSDGATRSLPAFNRPDLAETIVKAYHGESFPGKYPTEKDFQIIYVVSYEQAWAELFLYGDWSRATQKVNNYKGIRVEMMDDSYAGKLQIKVYGDKDGKDASGNDKYKEQYAELASGTNTTTVIFDSSILGSTFWGVTLQTLSGICTAKVKSATLIKTDGTEVPTTITAAWGCSVTTEATPITGIQPILTTPSYTDNAIYDLSGRRVNNPTKGLYIMNGRKVVIR